MYIQWFPGHMTKAIRMMEDSLRLVDALIYVIDARAVLSCMNPALTRLIGGKKVLYVLNKCDLVEREDTALWRAYFEDRDLPYVTAVGSSGDCAQIVKGLKDIMSDKLDKFRAKGANIAIRAMVVGVPNSGKSTIINSMIKKAKAVTGDRPGVTRGKQWLSVDGVDFLDTPGTLWSKFDDQRIARHLAFIGSIKDDVLDVEELSFALIEELLSISPKAIEDRYSIPSDGSAQEIFAAIASSRGYKLKGGEPDYERTARMLIDEFRKGKLGKIMLEKP